MSGRTCSWTLSLKVARAYIESERASASRASKNSRGLCYRSPDGAVSFISNAWKYPSESTNKHSKSKLSHLTPIVRCADSLNCMEAAVTSL